MNIWIVKDQFHVDLKGFSTKRKAELYLKQLAKEDDYHYNKRDKIVTFFGDTKYYIIELEVE